MKRVSGVEEGEDFEMRFRVSTIGFKADRINKSEDTPNYIYGSPVTYENGLVKSVGPIKIRYDTNNQIDGLGNNSPPKEGYSRELLPEVLDLDERFELFGLGIYAELVNKKMPDGVGDRDQGYAVEYDSQSRVISFGEVDTTYDGNSKTPSKVGTLEDTWDFWTEGTDQMP